jgi:CBS-domain-containing membrane protein
MFEAASYAVNAELNAPLYAAPLSPFSVLLFVSPSFSFSYISSSWTGGDGVGINVACSVPLCVRARVCACVFYVVALICRGIFSEHVLKEHMQ